MVIDCYGGENMVTALLLSGGTGTRMGVETPKQYIEVEGRPIIAYCLRTLFSHEGIDAVQIVADEMWRELILECVDGLGAWEEDRDADIGNVQGIGGMPPAGRKNKFRGFSVPGETRQLSILNGLEDIGKYAVDSDYVLIHDAARPLLTAGLVTDCLSAAADHDGAIPVLPMKDTVYFSENGEQITSLLARSRIFAGQAPEAFLFGKYTEAVRNLLPERIFKINGSTEPAVMAGMDIAMIPGDEGNFKITTKADLERFRECVSICGGQA